MISSINYHKIFDYPLTQEELLRWRYKNVNEKTTNTKNKKRLEREKISRQKLIIAKKASKILSLIPTIKFVGVTGSLAMMNAKKESDIDLMVITKSNTLWATRLLCLIIFTGRIRRAKNNNEEDKLCFNMWLDENDLIWDKKDRNIYTAHEIAQVIPLVDKDKTYEKFLYLNRWLLDFWPNSVDKKYMVCGKSYIAANTWIEKMFFWIQYKYMRSKITREVITPTRAIFHPNDWGKIVMKKLEC